MIVVSCAIGAYAIQNAMFDIWLMLGFGVVGYVFKKIGIPLAPFTLALVLGNRAEDAFRLSMIGAGGDLRVFWSNGLVGSITTLALILLFWPLLGRLFERRQPAVAPCRRERRARGVIRLRCVDAAIDRSRRWRAAIRPAHHPEPTGSGSRSSAPAFPSDHGAQVRDRLLTNCHDLSKAESTRSTMLGSRFAVHVTDIAMPPAKIFLFVSHADGEQSSTQVDVATPNYCCTAQCGARAWLNSTLGYHSTQIA